MTFRQWLLQLTPFKTSQVRKDLALSAASYKEGRRPRRRGRGQGGGAEAKGEGQRPRGRGRGQVGGVEAKEEGQRPRGRGRGQGGGAEAKWKGEGEEEARTGRHKCICAIPTQKEQGGITCHQSTSIMQ